MGSIDKTMEEIVTRGSFCHFLIKSFFNIPVLISDVDAAKTMLSPFLIGISK